MPTMYGLSSGIDTKKIIQDLKEVEKQPIRRLEKQKREADLENKVLQELQNVAKSLETQAKVLFNVDSKYEAKKVMTTDSDSLRGVATKKAENSEYEIKIKNLATKLIIASRNIKPDEKIPSGNIFFTNDFVTDADTTTGNNLKKKFNGGNLNQFKKFLNKNFPDTLSAKTIKISSTAEKLIIESRKEGKKGVFNIKDPDHVLENLEIFNQNPKQASQNDSNKNFVNSNKESFADILFDNIKMNIISDGPSQISADQKALSLNKKAAKELVVSPPKKRDTKIKALNLSLNHQPNPPPEEDTTPLRLSFGPIQTINIKNIILDTYNADRNRERKEPILDEIDYGIILKSHEGASRKISFKDKTGLQQIPIKENISSIGFYTSNTKISFINPIWVYEVIPPLDNDGTNKNTNDSDSQQMANFPNLIKPGQDSKIMVDGVELKRDKNKGLDDVIDGVELELLKTTEAPVKINVLGDHEEVIKQVIDFVGAYNQLLEFAQENSKTDKLADNVGKFDSEAKLKGKTGLLITNLAVRNLINGIKRRVSNPYPAFREPNIKISAMLGISTGKIGANWQDISKGYLQVDQDLLIQRLTENPIAVKEFFGSDTNQDFKIDDGLAFQVYKFLKPYTQKYGRGIIYSSINFNKERIKQLNKQITKVEEKAERYEDRLKREFGSMESVIQKQKSIGGQIRNRFQNHDK